MGWNLSSVGTAFTTIWLAAWAFHVRPGIVRRKVPFRIGADLGITILNDYLHLRELRRREGDRVWHLDLILLMGLTGPFLIVGAFLPFARI